MLSFIHKKKYIRRKMLSSKRETVLRAASSTISLARTITANDSETVRASLLEWEIPFSQLCLKGKIGEGHFGVVYRGLWFGDVAIKILNDDILDEFHSEIRILKKTRHDNLVLFMGACMHPPKLAIVTALCQGESLYRLIHHHQLEINYDYATFIAREIIQGMGYLHSRDIIHKDLKSKNIFVEHHYVRIADFGLFNATKLFCCPRRGLEIPNKWLQYLAPELIRLLQPFKSHNQDQKNNILPFSKASDSYAFGTIWYELFCRQLPFNLQPSESIIWQVGRGMKQSLTNILAGKDVKEIFIYCWMFDPQKRINFSALSLLLQRLPKSTTLNRSSDPVNFYHSKEV